MNSVFEYLCFNMFLINLYFNSYLEIFNYYIEIFLSKISNIYYGLFKFRYYLLIFFLLVSYFYRPVSAKDSLSFYNINQATSFCCRVWRESLSLNSKELMQLCPNKFKGSIMHYCGKSLNPDWYEESYKTYWTRLSNTRNAGDTYNNALTFCCECFEKNLICKICTIARYNIICNSPGETEFIWYNSYFKPAYNILKYQATSYTFYYTSSKILYYHHFGEVDYFFPVNATSCQGQDLLSSKSGYNTAFQCISAGITPYSCPKGNVTTVSCDYVNNFSANHEDIRTCTPLVNRNVRIIRNGNKICSNGYVLDLPFVTEYLINSIDEPGKLIPEYLGYSDTTTYYSAFDISDIENFISENDLTNINTIIPVNNKMGLSLEFSFKDYDLSGSFLGEYYITTFCHANYIRYNITHKICSGAFLRSEIIHPDWLFLYDPIDVVTYTYDIENTHIFKNITCDISKKFFECGLLDMLNNISSKHNITSFESVKYFIELMGKNDSNVHFYTTDSLGNKRLVGNWFSGIFGVLIQPFFDVFVETVKLLLGIVADLLVVVIESLVKALGALIKPVADILEVLLKLIVSSVAIVESKILLLEYTLLFLFLMYFVFNNVYFASVVVIIFMLIFGITRRSPSLILPLLNKELNYFSLDDYYRTKFDYNYSINYHTDSALYTFSFLIGNYSFVKLN